MPKRVNFFIAFLLILFAGTRMNAKEYESPVYTQYAAEVTSSFLKQMHKEFGFECDGSGGRMPYDVEEISVQLVAYRSATVEQARELEIQLTERFVQIINAHEKIRPFLREYPFPSNRASVAISFEKPKKKKISSNEGNVAFVFQAKDRIFYRAENPENPYVFKAILDEPYEEARKIVRNNALKKPQQEPKNL